MYLVELIFTVHRACFYYILVGELSVGFSSVVESVAWFNKSPDRRYRPGGDESSSSGEGQEQNDPSDDGLLLFVAISIDETKLNAVVYLVALATVHTMHKCS